MPRNDVQIAPYPCHLSAEVLLTATELPERLGPIGNIKHFHVSSHESILLHCGKINHLSDQDVTFGGQELCMLDLVHQGGEVCNIVLFGETV